MESDDCLQVRALLILLGILEQRGLSKKDFLYLFGISSKLSFEVQPALSLLP